MIMSSAKGGYDMSEQKMSYEVMEYMVWMVEIAAREFFNRDKTDAYDALKKSGLWDLYVDNYDVTNTHSAENLLAEMRESFTTNEVMLPC